jgi:hypothetical protein
MMLGSVASRYVQAQIRGHDRRKRDFQGLDTPIHFPRHRGLAARHAEFGSKRRLGPTQKRRQHLARLVGIIVNGLFAADHELRRFLVRQGMEQLGHRQGLQFHVGFHQDGPIRPEGQRVTQRFLTVCRAATHHHDLRGNTGFLEPYRFFHGDFIEGIHGHFDVGQIHRTAIGLGPWPDVVVNHPFDGNENLQSCLLFISPARLTPRPPECKLSIRCRMECVR